MCRWYDLVVAAEDDIATLMTVESGKPLKESKGEFTSGCACSAEASPRLRWMLAGEYAALVAAPDPWMQMRSLL